MKRLNKKVRIVLATMLCLTMAFSLTTLLDVHAENDIPCEHHDVHTEECGYIEAQDAVEEKQCQNVCEICNAIEEDENEEAITNENNTDIVSTGICEHHPEHDETCGYVPAQEAIEGHPCEFVCEICNQEVVDEEDINSEEDLPKVSTIDAKDEDKSVSAYIGTTPMTQQQIIKKMGIATNFAVFAIDFYNDNHMEGAIAVKNLREHSAAFGNTSRALTYNEDVAQTATLTKYSDIPGKYTFGIYEDEKGTKLYKTVIVTVDEDGRGSVNLDDLSKGPYYIYEIDSDGNAIINDGHYTVNDTEFDVSYDYDGVSTKAGGSGIGNTSYIENFVAESCNVGLFNSDEKSELVIGKNNKIKTNGGQAWVVGANDVEYEYSPQHTTVRIADPFPIDFQTEMNKLKSLSVELADLASSNDVIAAYASVGADGNVIPEVTVDGDKIIKDLNEWKDIGVETNGKLFVLNIDCTDAGNNTIKFSNFKVNGCAAGDWGDGNHYLLWNFYMRDTSGKVQPFTGKIVANDAIGGTVLAPSASFTADKGMNGAVIGDTAYHPSGEIHHSVLLSAPYIKRISCTNATAINDGTGSLKIKKNVTVNGESTTGTLADGSYKFEITNDSGYKKTVTITIVNGQSKTVTVSGLEPGKYTIKEVDLPDDTKVDKTSVTIEVTENNTAHILTAEFTNNKTVDENNALGSLTIIKTSIGNTTPQDATFIITGPHGYIKTVKYSEFENNQITLAELEFGEYTIIEVGANIEGFGLTVDGNGTVEITSDLPDVTVELINTYSQDTTNLIIYKVDQDMEFLEGAEFSLYRIIDDSEELIDVQSGEPRFIFTDLLDGYYRVEESVIPDGYTGIDSFYIEIIDGKVYYVDDNGEHIYGSLDILNKNDDTDAEVLGDQITEEQYDQWLLDQLGDEFEETYQSQDVKTGDETHITGYAIAAIVSLSLGLYTLSLKKKLEQDS